MSSALNEEQFPIVPALGFTFEKLWADRHALLSEARFPFAALSLLSMAGIVLHKAGVGEDLQVTWMIVSFIIGFFVLAPICIRWNRAVILGESVREPGPVFPENTVAYAVTQIVILLLLLAVAIFMSLPVAMVEITLSGGQQSDEGLMATALVSILLALMVISRLFTFLAAVAVKDQSMNLRRVWELTQGNGLRLAAGLLIIGLAVALAGIPPSFLMMSFLADVLPITLLAALSMINAVEAIVLQLALAGFFARAYLHFRGRSGPAEDTD